MTPHKQKYLYDPAKGVYGDCYRTCLASLRDADPETVPNFADPEIAKAFGESFDDAIDNWLAGEGLYRVTVAIEAEKDTPPGHALQKLGEVTVGINGYYLLCGESRLGCNHAVICCGDKIVHDPSGFGIVAPIGGKIGDHPCYRYLVHIITPFGQRRK